MGRVRPHGFDQVAGLQRAGVVGGVGDLRAACVAGQAEDGAPGPRVPPGRAEAGEGRNQHHPVIGPGGLGQPLDARRAALHPQLLAEPLDRRPGDEDRALQGIGRPAAHPGRHGGQQAGLRHRPGRAGVEQHEAAGAVGGLHLAGRHAPLAHQGALLVADHAADRHGRAQDLRQGLAEVAGGVAHLGQQRVRHAEQRQHGGRPGLELDVEQQSPRRVGGVRGVDRAAGQPPDHPRIDGAAKELAPFGPRPRALDVIQHPGDLGGREIGVQQQARDLGHFRFRRTQPRTYVRRAAVLPDDGGVDGPAGRPVPDHHRLALVGEADGGDLRHGPAGGLDHLAHHLDAGLVDLLGVVLDPAVGRIGLAQGPLGCPQWPSAPIEEDRAGAGRALVQSEQQRLGHASLPSFALSAFPVLD